MNEYEMTPEMEKDLADEMARQARSDFFGAIKALLTQRVDSGFDSRRWHILYRIKALVCLLLRRRKRFMENSQEQYRRYGQYESAAMVWAQYSDWYGGWNGVSVHVPLGWRRWWVHLEHDGDCYL